MRKIFAIGTLLLSSTAALVMPAAAADRYDYRAPQSYEFRPGYPVYESYQARVARLRRERLERERLERERRLREMRFHRNDGWSRR